MSNRITIDSNALVQASPPAELLEKRFRKGVYRMELDGMYKRCSRCKDYWPADSEFFYKTKSSKDGLIDWCKACYQEWRWPNGRPSQKGISQERSNAA
jgi:hypothetical protein